MTADDRLLASIAEANPVTADAQLDPEARAEALRVRARVLAAAGGERRRRPARLRPAAALVASLALVLGVAGLVLAGHEGRGGHAGHAVRLSRGLAGGGGPGLTGVYGQRRPSVLPWWHVPGSKKLVSVAPGRIAIVRVRLPSGGRYFIYGQRIRFWGRLYFCLSAGDADGSFQSCPPWPLARVPTTPMIGGMSGSGELAVAVAGPGARCTFHHIGRTDRVRRVLIPARLKVDGEVIYAALIPTRSAPHHPRGSGTAVLVGAPGGPTHLLSCRR